MRALAWLWLAALPLAAQDWYPKHNFTIGGGFARPRGDIVPGMGDTGALNISYGYRFTRNLQLDIGWDTAFHAADVKAYLDTGIGFQRIRDYEYFIPFGGRVILPIDRFFISGGAGGAYLRYSERLHQPSSYYKIDCPVCASRSGWGYYALANTGAFLDQGRHFRLGVTVKMYRAHTEGEPLQEVPGVRTKDRWLMIGADFGVSF
jgi:hypothetical protein